MHARLCTLGELKKRSVCAASGKSCSMDSECTLNGGKEVCQAFVDDNSKCDLEWVWTGSVCENDNGSSLDHYVMYNQKTRKEKCIRDVSSKDNPDGHPSVDPPFYARTTAGTRCCADGPGADSVEKVPTGAPSPQPSDGPSPSVFYNQM